MTKKPDLWIFLGIIIAAIVMWIILSIQTSTSLKVKVSVEGSVYGTYSIDKPQQITISRDGKTNVIEIHNNGVKMLKANCPDKLCVGQGFVESILFPIICLPNKVVVEIID